MSVQDEVSKWKSRLVVGVFSAVLWLSPVWAQENSIPNIPQQNGVPPSDAAQSSVPPQAPQSGPTVASPEGTPPLPVRNRANERPDMGVGFRPDTPPTPEAKNFPGSSGMAPLPNEGGHHGNLEYLSAGKEEMAKLFGQIDVNKDNQISKEEFSDWCTMKVHSAIPSKSFNRGDGIGDQRNTFGRGQRGGFDGPCAGGPQMNGPGNDFGHGQRGGFDGPCAGGPQSNGPGGEFGLGQRGGFDGPCAGGFQSNGPGNEYGRGQRGSFEDPGAGGPQFNGPGGEFGRGQRGSFEGPCAGGPQANGPGGEFGRGQRGSFEGPGAGGPQLNGPGNDFGLGQRGGFDGPGTAGPQANGLNVHPESSNKEFDLFAPLFENPMNGIGLGAKHDMFGRFARPGIDNGFSPDKSRGIQNGPNGSDYPGMMPMTGKNQMTPNNNPIQPPLPPQPDR